MFGVETANSWLLGYWERVVPQLFHLPQRHTASSLSPLDSESPPYAVPQFPPGAC